MRIQKQTAFTLVELIVVIVILAILWTIAFISLQWYSKDARDSTRVSDISSMKTSLELFHLDAWKYPLTTDGYTVTYSWSSVWNQWIFGEDTFKNVWKLDSIPVDPVTEKPYTYSVTATRQEYQFAGIMEWEWVSLMDKVYAWDIEGTALVSGNYNGVILKTLSWSNCSVISLPSIISNQEETTTDLVDILSSQWLVYHGYKNLPTNYRGSKYKADGGFAFSSQKLVLHSDGNECNDLYLSTASWTTARSNLLSNLQFAYSGTILEWKDNVGQYTRLDINDTTQVENIAGALVNNVLWGSVEIAAASSSSSSSSGWSSITNSLRFNDDDQPYLSRTPSTAWNTKTWTWAWWFKRSNLAIPIALMSANLDGDDRTYIYIWWDDVLSFNNQIAWSYKQMFVSWRLRDPSEWTHIIVAVDTTQVVDTDRVKIYINGVLNQDYSSATYPAQNDDTYINAANIQWIGYQTNLWVWFRHIDGYLSDVHLVDGQALDASNFWQFRADGKWIPKTVNISNYGTNGFALNFWSGSNLGIDSSGNGNDFVANNFDTTDQVIDTPSNNFATLNPLDLTNATLSQWNLRIVATSNNWASFSTIEIPETGKYYLEMYDEFITTNSTPYVSVWDIVYMSYGRIFDSSEYVYTEVADNATLHDDGDYISALVDADAWTVEFFHNNVSQWVFNNAFTNGRKIRLYLALSWDKMVMNFGQWWQVWLQNCTWAWGSFKYCPPAWYKALSTANLPSSTISNPSDHFDIVTYTWNGITQSITDLSFQPDFTWIKWRTWTSRAHVLQNSINWAWNYLISNTTSAEQYLSNYITNFTPNWFDLWDWWAVNASTEWFVAWNWKGGWTAVSNTDGTITSQVSVNQTAWFSIASYRWNWVLWATIWHGLNQSPELTFIKNRDTWTTSWVVLTSVIDWSQDYLYLNSNGPKWDNVAASLNPTTFAVWSWLNGNESWAKLISYSFHSVPWYSKIWSYTWNGNTDGPFIYTGFKPKYIMVKRTNDIGYWDIIDSQREKYNPRGKQLMADNNSAEPASVDHDVDFLSNGFKWRDTSNSVNANASTYIYIAFAEYPFK